MAPTRGFRRALIAVAAIIVAARFFVRQRSPPKPVPVRTVTRLLAHYMTTPPEAPPVKLRRKAGYDAGSAFKRWARRRGKGG